MAGGDNTPIALEVAHILFLDIVGYSRLATKEQHRAVQTLNEIVRSSAQFQQADGSDRLLKIPTGDGMSLVFYTTPDAPARCAVEISRGLKDHPELNVRMGVHSGSVSGLNDVTGRANIAGAGINIAQRVMDCGDAGHILISKHAADDLHEYDEWRPHLHDLGPCQVKHGVRVHVVNLWDNDFGNRTIPTKFRAQKRQASKRRLIAIAAAAGVLIASAVAFFAWRSADQTEKRIAVLPFRPLLPDQRDEILEIGMADTLISRLSNTREIVVPSLTSVRRYAGITQDSLAAGRELGVGSVVEGSIQRVSDRIRVAVRLIRVSDGSSLWGETFEEKFSDVFEVQDKIAQRIMRALTLRLSGQGHQRLIKHDTENIEAYQLYLTGRYHFAKLSPPEVAKSIAFFQKAIELDPNYALAHFGLADAYRGLCIIGDMPSKELLPQAKEAAEKAIDLDRTLAEPHAALSLVHLWFDYDWAAAEREAKRGIALNPNSWFCRFAYSHFLSNMGRHQEAIREAARARELDPTSLLANFREGSALFFARDYNKARERLFKLLELDPSSWHAHLFLGHISLQEGQLDDALTSFTKAREFSRDNSETVAMVAFTLSRMGQPEKTETILGGLSNRSSARYVPPYAFAVIQLGLGDIDAAMEALEKAYQERDVRMSFIKIYPILDPIRSDPRFLSLLKRMNFQ